MILKRRFDVDSRENKIEKILAVLKFVVCSNDFSNLTLLDVGTGSGIISKGLSKHFKKVYSVDIVDERLVKDGYTFLKVTDEKLPFCDDTFDIILSNCVIEHLINQELHLDEVMRVMKNTGYFYLSFPNKYSLFEPHYNLIFLSYLPKKLANKYMQFFNKGDSYDIFPFTLSKGMKLCNKFRVNNITPLIVKNPDLFKLDVYRKIQPFLKIIPLSFIKFIQYFFPTYIFILKK